MMRFPLVIAALVALALQSATAFTAGRPGRFGLATAIEGRVAQPSLLVLNEKAEEAVEEEVSTKVEDENAPVSNKEEGEFDVTDALSDTTKDMTNAAAENMTDEEKKDADDIAAKLQNAVSDNEVNEKDGGAKAEKALENATPKTEVEDEGDAEEKTEKSD